MSKDASLAAVYTYDPNGNTYSKVTEVLAEGDGDAGLELGESGWELYEYDAWNQLVGVSIDGEEVSYAYRPTGCGCRRLRSRVR